MSNNVDKVFKDNFKYYRKKAGVTQEELAEQLKKTPYTIGQFERGELNPAVNTLVDISLKLNTPVENLLFADEAEREFEHQSILQKLEGKGKEQLLDILNALKALYEK